MKKSIIDYTILACFSIFSQFACADEWGTIKIPANQPIKIAFDNQLEMQFGGIKLGIEMAIKEKNSMRDHPLRLELKMPEHKNIRSDHLSKIFCNDPHTVGVIGYADRADVQSALSTHLQQKVILVSPLGILAKQMKDKSPVIFNMCCSHKLQARKAVEFALSRKKKKIAVIHNTDEFSRKLGRDFTVQIQMRGAEVLFETSLSNNYYLSGMIKKIKTLKCDLIYYAGPSELGILVIQEMDAVGLHNTYFIAGAACHNFKFLSETSGIPMANCYVVAPRKPSREWSRKFVTQYGLSPGFSPYGYDAAHIFINALKAVTLKNSYGRMELGKKALADAVKNAKIKGVSGEIEFDSKGCRTSSALAIYHVFDNEEEGFRLFKETPSR